MTDPSARPERIFAGTVGKAHGLDGSFYVVQGLPALLERGASVWVGAEAEPREITRRAGTDARPILRLGGSASRNDADALRGLAIEVPSAVVGELGEDEYWAHQLVGSAVTAAADGRALGTVVELMALPSCEVLVVRAEADGEPDADPADAKSDGTRRGDLLVPMVKDAIVEIDPAGRRVVVDAEFLALDEG